MYGCEIWGFHKADDIEKIHIKFLKHVLGVRRQTCNLAVNGELGRVPLERSVYLKPAAGDGHPKLIRPIFPRLVW